MKRIPHSRPFLGTPERKAAAAVITSGMLSQGREVSRFEKELAAELGRRHGVAVSSGTAALHLALVALTVGKGDRVAVPSYTCTGLLHAISLVGAEPLVVDVDPHTFNMDPDDVRRRCDGRVKAIILPHMFGLAADVDAIHSLGVPVIEDCALALGARGNSGSVGRVGELAILSFYATKMITTGEGGMVLGDRRTLLRIVQDRRSYDGRCDHRERYNYKMTDLQAAIGRVQLGRLEAFVTKRRRLARLYFDLLRGGPWELPVSNANAVYYRFVLRVRSAGRMLSELDRRGIEARRPVFKPLHRYLGLKGFPGTEEAYRRAVSIPLYPGLSAGDANRISKAMWRSVKDT